LERLGSLERLEPLREGVLGPVYKGWDPRVEQPVVITLLGDELQGEPERREAFLREARAAAQLEHAHLAAVHSVVEDEGRSYVVRPFVEGELLSRRLERAGPLSLTEAVQAVAEAASALAEAHRRGVTHGGLAPDTLVATPAGSVKVLDLGVARRGVERGDRRADVVGLATTLVTLASGETPKPGTGVATLRPLLEGGAADVGPLADLLASALAEGGDAQSTDAEAFSRALAEAVKPIVPDAPVPPPAPRVPGAGTGDRAVRSILLGIVLLAGLMWAWRTWGG
jgi:serine/threonine protein kinase